jgi:hypothetical protein
LEKHPFGVALFIACHHRLLTASPPYVKLVLNAMLNIITIGI